MSTREPRGSSRGAPATVSSRVKKSPTSKSQNPASPSKSQKSSSKRSSPRHGTGKKITPTDLDVDVDPEVLSNFLYPDNSNIGAKNAISKALSAANRSSSFEAKVAAQLSPEDSEGSEGSDEEESRHPRPSDNRSRRSPQNDRSRRQNDRYSEANISDSKTFEATVVTVVDDATIESRPAPVSTVSIAASKKTTTSHTNATTPSHYNHGSDIKLSSERIEVLVMQLRETMDEKEASTIILEFALRVKNHELVIQGGDISIIAAMKRFSNSSKVQTRGCKALAEIANKGLSNIESIIDKGGTEIILVAMERHRAEEELQKEACRAIESIVRGSKQGKQAFGFHCKDAIVSILHCMGDHIHSAKLQRLACRSLASIAEDHADCSLCIVNQNGLESIRITLKHHDDNTDVIENAITILINMAAAVGKFALDEQIALTISMDRVLSTMLLYRRDEKMQSHGMALLCILCKSSPRNRAKISTLYGLEVILKSLETCIVNKDVQRHGTTLIQNLCQSEGNAVAAGLMSEGGMELLLNIMRRHGSDPVIVQQIFLIIAKMARPFSDKIRQEGGIELILSGMRRHEENLHVQEAACLALWKLSLKTENANIINGNGGGTLITAALSRFPEDEGIQEVACEALATLSQDKQQILAQKTLKARAVAIAVEKEPEVQSGCCSCGVGCF